MDEILIKGVECRARIGVPDEERAAPQQVAVDLVIQLDLEKAAAADDLDQTVNYQRLVQRVQATVRENEFRLLESLAAHLCRIVLSDTRIEGVQVTVRKSPRALRHSVDHVGVKMTRKRPPCKR
ncbi:MAG: dihydroneopterin aldolase [Acidobacteriota bacterium]